MRAVVIDGRGGPEVLRVVGDHPEPQVRGPRDLVVRVDAASVNPVDTYLRGGKIPIPLRYPWILGGDGCGVVEALGAKVSRFVVGDRVVGLLDYTRRPGCYAERALFHEDELARAPAALTSEVLAALPMVTLTAWTALADAGALRRGARVLLCGGAGGVGSVAIPIAKILGAAEVVVVASAASAAACRERGADTVLDYGHPRPFADAGRFDVILDAVGGYYPKTIELLADGGTFVSITSLADSEAYTFGNFVQHLGRLVTTGFGGLLGGRRVRSTRVVPDGERLRTILGHVESGLLPAPPVVQYRLQDAAEAHRAIESKRTRGKLVLVP